MKASLFIAIVFIASLVAVCGCDALPFGQQQPPPIPPPTLVPPPPMPGAIPPPVMPVAPPPAVAPLPVPAVAMAVPPYQWIDKPVIDTVPQAPLGGMANGRPFNTQAIVIEPIGDKWKMKIHDKPLEAPTSLIMGGQALTIDLPFHPGVGAKFTREMAYGDGYFQISNDPTNLEATTSWNAENAWAIEITKWEVADYDPDGDLYQMAGTASGRIAVCYKGNPTGIQNSWLAGDFEDVTVRYMGKPYFMEKGKSSSGKSSGKSGKKYTPPTLPDPKKAPEPKKDPAKDPAKDPVKKPEPKKEPPKKDKGETDIEKAKKTLTPMFKSLKDSYKKSKKKDSE